MNEIIITTEKRERERHETCYGEKFCHKDEFVGLKCNKMKFFFLPPEAGVEWSTCYGPFGWSTLVKKER